ncbi:MAG: class I SAM-dependent methyltransferase [Pseudoxanthomonas suwonensis]|nr:class I SAM-dependent methyltransferase [Pseudoxanthomonas suwonensis]
MSTRCHAQPAALARAFLRSPHSPVRYHYYYARTKLATDPVYAATLNTLAGSPSPVLDLGCGIGLLLHAMRNAGLDMAYTGVDLDPDKIRMAELGLANSGHGNAGFAVRDVSIDPPQHRGNVAILDVLQYLDRPAQETLLAQCAAMLGANDRLIIRSGLREDNARSRITRIADFFAHRVGWMEAAPRHFPTRDWFMDVLGRLRLAVEIRPLHGRLGLNNWLIVARPAN